MYRCRPACRNGRRGRLKICCGQPRAGSSPAAGIKIFSPELYGSGLFYCPMVCTPVFSGRTPGSHSQKKPCCCNPDGVDVGSRPNITVPQPFLDFRIAQRRTQILPVSSNFRMNPLLSSGAAPAASLLGFSLFVIACFFAGAGKQ